jgi:hypothetical protein
MMGALRPHLKEEQIKVASALINKARTECDRYVRERPEFYTEGTSLFWQLRQTLQEACRGYYYQSMIKAEPAIRQLLKLDFDQKVSDTVIRTYRQTINQTLNSHLLKSSEVQAESILQKYDQARDYLAQTLEKEAGDKIKNNQRLLAEVEQKIANYNKTVQSINSCLEAMQLDRKKLPTISPSDLATAIAPTNIPKESPVIEVESVEVSSEES